jgi:hypothetical protein
VDDITYFLQVAFPAVSRAKHVVEEVIAFLPRNLEADETPALSRYNGLLTFSADDDCPGFHRSPSELCLLFLMGQLVS